MNSYSLSHVSNDALLRDLATSVKQDRATTATMLAQIAEVDERKLFAGAGYESMFLYCVRELHMSEDTAFRRIRVARTARQFPAIFSLLADGRLNLTSVLLLTPHLTAETVDELLAAATHKTKPDTERLLDESLPRPGRGRGGPTSSRRPRTRPSRRSSGYLPRHPLDRISRRSCRCSRPRARATGRRRGRAGRA